MYRTAQKWKWLAENPPKWVDVGQRETVRKQRPVSVEEVRPLAEHLEEPARTVFILAVTTGLRIGEILGLQVDDVDLSGASSMSRVPSVGEKSIPPRRKEAHIKFLSRRC
jgi:integrase